MSQQQALFYLTCFLKLNPPDLCLISQESFDVYSIVQMFWPIQGKFTLCFGDMAGVKGSAPKSDRQTWFGTRLSHTLTDHLLFPCGNSQRRNQASSSTNGSLKGSGTEGQLQECGLNSDGHFGVVKGKELT